MNKLNICEGTLMLVFTLFLTACGSGSSSQNSDSISAATSLQIAMDIYASVPAEAFNKAEPSIPASAIIATAAISNTTCNSNGEPFENGIELTVSDNAYPAALAYCLTKQRTSNPDTVQGTIYLASAMQCVADKEGLFDGLSAGGSNTTTIDVPINKTCFGKQALIDELVADMGMTVLPDTLMTVTDLGNTASEYDYSLEVLRSGKTTPITALIKDSGNIIAAKTYSDSDNWAFSINKTTGTMLYENIEPQWNRRTRLLIKGTIKSDNTVSAVTRLEGVRIKSDDPPLPITNTIVATFTGNGSSILGNTYYTDFASLDQIVTNYCDDAGNACAGLNTITVNITNVEAFMNGIGAAATAQHSANTILDFNSVNISENNTY